MSTGRENQPTIFLVESDDETRPVLKSNLQRYGYRVVVALDEEDALERVSEGVGLPADLFLVDVVRMSCEDALELGRRLRAHARYDGRTPLVVMAETFGADLESTDVNVAGNDWITYLEDSYQLKNLLIRLVNK